MGNFYFGLPPETWWDRIKRMISNIHPTVMTAIITGLFGLLYLFFKDRENSNPQQANTSGSSSPAVMVPGDGNTVNISLLAPSQTNVESESSDHVIELHVLKMGNDVELTNLVARIASQSNVTGYVWGDYQLNIQYCGWSFHDSSLVCSGRIENIKGPPQYSSNPWEIKFGKTNGNTEISISLGSEPISTLEEISRDPRLSQYYKQWTECRGRILGNLADHLVYSLAPSLKSHNQK